MEKLVQTAVLPILLPAGVPSSLYSPFSPPQDICVSAPTGSGKTLSYVVPIVEVSLDSYLFSFTFPDFLLPDFKQPGRNSTTCFDPASDSRSSSSSERNV